MTVSSIAVTAFRAQLGTDFGDAPLGRLGDRQVQQLNSAGKRNVFQHIDGAVRNLFKGICTALAPAHVRANNAFRSELAQLSGRVGDLLTSLNGAQPDAEAVRANVDALVAATRPLIARGLDFQEVTGARLEHHLDKLSASQLEVLAKGLRNCEAEVIGRLTQAEGHDGVSALMMLSGRLTDRLVRSVEQEALAAMCAPLPGDAVASQDRIEEIGRAAHARLEAAGVSMTCTAKDYGIKLLQQRFDQLRVEVSDARAAGAVERFTDAAGELVRVAKMLNRDVPGGQAATLRDVQAALQGAATSIRSLFDAMAANDPKQVLLRLTDLSSYAERVLTRLDQWDSGGKANALAAGLIKDAVAKLPADQKKQLAAALGGSSDVKGLGSALRALTAACKFPHTKAACESAAANLEALSDALGLSRKTGGLAGLTPAAEKALAKVLYVEADGKGKVVEKAMLGGEHVMRAMIDGVTSLTARGKVGNRDVPVCDQFLKDVPRQRTVLPDGSLLFVDNGSGDQRYTDAVTRLTTLCGGDEALAFKVSQVANQTACAAPAHFDAAYPAAHLPDNSPIWLSQGKYTFTLSPHPDGIVVRLDLTFRGSLLENGKAMAMNPQTGAQYEVSPDTHTRWTTDILVRRDGGPVFLKPPVGLWDLGE